METKKMIWIGVIVVLVLIGALLFYSLNEKFFNKNITNSSNISNNNLSGTFPIVKKEVWCNYNEEWDNSRIISNKTFIKQYFVFANNETLCRALSQDKSEMFAFNKDESKIYRVVNFSSFGNSSVKIIPAYILLN